MGVSNKKRRCFVMKTKVIKNSSFSIRNIFVSLVKYLIIAFSFFFVGAINTNNEVKADVWWEWVDNSATTSRSGDTITFRYNYFNFTLRHWTSGVLDLNSSCYMSYSIGSYTTGEFNERESR